MRVAADAEPVEGVGDRKDAVRPSIETNVVVVDAATTAAAVAAADGYLVRELREEVVKVGERRGPVDRRGAWRGFRRG